MIDWGWPDVMQHMQKDNIALIVPRQFKEESGAFISTDIVGHKSVSAYDINYLFPLYLYETAQKKKHAAISTMMLFESATEYGKSKGRKANIAQALFEQLKNAYGKVPTPEQILSYCYAVLYSNIYREKYAEFLKIDFPRIPFTKNHELFLQMAEMGSELTELHLLKHKALNNPLVKYRGKGTDDTIRKIKYDELNNRLYINEERYFEDVTKELYEYQIGGYKVVEHYLKDRKDRQIGEDMRQICKISTALAKTIEVQKEIDTLFKKVEKGKILDKS